MQTLPILLYLSMGVSSMTVFMGSSEEDEVKGDRRSIKKARREKVVATHSKAARLEGMRWR